MDNYIETAKNIVKESIKSAVYIDDNAWEPYTVLKKDPNVEEKLSSELYTVFRSEGVSLAIIKFARTKYKKQIKYYFHNRDLIILDWQLEKDNGGEKALELLSDVVSQQHIHFCAIYTSEKDKNCILNNILSFFSSNDGSFYNSLKIRLEENENVDPEEMESIIGDLQSLNLYQQDADKQDPILKRLHKEHANLLKEFISVTNNENETDAYVQCSIAWNKDVIKSSASLPSPTSIDPKSHTLIIENTVIQIINKAEITPSKLIDTFSEHIANYKWGIMQLVGLEMQNYLRNQCAFVTPDILLVSKESLGYHKKTHQEDFESFLKSVLLEQNRLFLQEKHLTIIDSIDEHNYDKKYDKEIISMNVFYNSIVLNKKDRLSFGDVFQYTDNDEIKYYICISALCDCARPEKRENHFFFAQGKSISAEKALKTGDCGFISFLNNGTFVQWSDNPDKKIARPIYVVPEDFFIKDPSIKDGKLTAVKIIKTTARKIHQKKFSFQYIATIKQNYAQRIANHAFSHPARVGIDFVKINEK